MRFQVFFLVFILIELIEGQISPQPISDNPEITIPNGKIRGKLVGFRGSKVFQFIGIPFAEPPVNELRFKRPVPVKPWDDVLSYSNWTSKCIQGPLPGGSESPFVSEDCLNLNVFTPAFALGTNSSQKLRPVMVWIHGGGFAYGSANEDTVNGTVLVALENVVLVSINYRLGALGFLHLPEYGINGNLGLWDQQLALQWVKENIKYFGGDPDQVTIFGESAGSMSVSAHILSPQSQGLFKNAILQSGSLYNIDLLYDKNATEKLLHITNCSSSDDIGSCLRTVDAKAFAALNGFVFWPIFGDEFIPKNPNELIKSIDTGINIFLGVAGNEGAAFLQLLNSDPLNPRNLTIEKAKKIIGHLYGDSLIDYFTERYLNKVDGNNSDEIGLAVCESYGDIILACPTFMFGHDALNYSNANVYAYFLSQKPRASDIPVGYPKVTTHADDVPFVFGLPLSHSDYGFDDFLLSLKMMEIWGNFARTSETPILASQEWYKWKLNESGKVEIFVMELNSQKLGQINNELALNCQRDWPFPVTHLNSLSSVK